MFDILTGNHLRHVRQCGRFWIKDGLENIDNDDDDDVMVGGSQSTDLTSGDGVMINNRKTERELFVIRQNIR